MRPIKLHIFDFDSTLFKSPEKPDWWDKGWWGNLNSLSEPCVPETPPPDWWNDSVVQDAKRSLANTEVRTVLMTGRIPKFSLRVKSLLKQVGLEFPEVYFSTGGPTEAFKVNTIKKILDEMPSIRGVSIWEDRETHLRVFTDWVESRGIACTPHLITVASHKAICQSEKIGETGLGEKQSPSPIRVAARYKSKKKDEDGNVHYEYSDRQVQNRHNEKAERVENLRKDMGDLRKKIRTDLSSKDSKVRLPALAAALIDETCERVGNDTSAKDGHFGVTGWRKKHLSFSKGEAVFKYVGKSGVDHEKRVTTAPVVRILRELAKGKSGDDCLFSDGEFTLKSKDVNDYLSEFDITAKDIRGFRANQEMCRALKEQRRRGPKLPKARKERDKILKEEFAEALEEVADIVGHEKATLRSDYLVPKMEDTYMKDGTVLSVFKEATKSEAEKDDESAAALIKPSPKKKPPRQDLRKHRIDSEDSDIDTKDDDMSLNYKKVGSVVLRFIAQGL